MDYDEFIVLVKERRSIRKFQSRPVPMDMVMQIVEAGRWAPSGDNSQPWEFIVIREKNILDQVIEILIESGRQCREACPRFSFLHPERLRGVSILIIVCADTRFQSAYPQSTKGHRLEDMYIKNSRQILIESVSGAITMMNLAAVSLGLGTVFLSSPGERWTGNQLKSLLHIPEALLPLCCLPIGYPSHLRHAGISPKSRRPRPLETMVHLDGFDESKWRTDEYVQTHTRVGRQAWAEFYRTGVMEKKP